MADLKKEIEAIKQSCLSELTIAETERDIKDIRHRYLGRKSRLNSILRSIKDIPPDERPLIGSLANKVREELEKATSESINRVIKSSVSTSPDLTLPTRPYRIGRSHIITRTTNELVSLLERVGFEVALGCEIETPYYNFEALNMPDDHPARDIQDTLYLVDGTLLRTHTSPVQIRYMETHKPPIRMIAPGRVYREENIDASHLPMFYQLEGLMVDKGVRFSDLKGILEYVAKRLFSKDLKTRFRPSFFPFTEPSAEMDVECPHCRGRGCNVCGYTGWIEILGAGLVHPYVFESVGYDRYDVSGFAFGMGIERIAMARHKIDDIRVFYQSGVRFLTGL